MRFVDDPSILHCRIVLICHGGNHCHVCTPDRDINETRLEVGDVYSEVLKMPNGNLPAGVRGGSTYLPKHSDKGEFTQEELLALTIRAGRHPVEGEARKRVSGKVLEDGRVVGEAAHGRPAGQPEDVQDDGKIWLTVYASSGRDLGSEVSPPVSAKNFEVNGKTFAIFGNGEDEILARKVNAAEVAKMASLFKMGSSGDENRDLRVLPILFDVAEERHRSLDEAVPEYEEVEFDDFPLTGPRTMYRDVRQLRRLGMDFVQHHESWLKKSGVKSSDRSVYEHSSICRVLNYMASYDQLNIPSLACAEALNRRRALIEVAHQGRPEAPSYEGAEEMLGVKETADGSLVDPALTQYSAKKQAAKAEILKQKRLAQEEKRLGRRVNDDDPDPRGAGKGRGRGRGGKEPPQDP